MARPVRRRTALYCTVISPGQLVVARMPDRFVPWSTIRRELHATMRREHGVLARDISTIEGLAGAIDGDTDGGEGMALCERAFGGDETTLRGFALHAWNRDEGCFRLVRGPTATTG